MYKILLIAVLFSIGSPAFAQKSKDAKFYYEAAMKQSDLKKVIFNFSKAIELQPNYVEAIYYRGVAYFHNKELNKALADFNKVSQLDPKHFGAMTYRGRTKEAKKKNSEALSDYNTAITLNPKYGEGLYYRGLYYRNHGNTGKACADLKLAKKNGYNVPDADMTGCNGAPAKKTADK